MKLDAIFVVPIIFVEVAKKGNLLLDSASIMIIGTKNPQLLCKIHSYMHDLVRYILYSAFCSCFVPDPDEIQGFLK